MAFTQKKAANIPHDKMAYKGDRSKFPKDRDSVAMGEGMNQDFPTSPHKDRYRVASGYRMKAIQKAMGK